MAEGLRFAGVGFAWPGRAPLLSGLDFTLSPGGITAVVGASGCGKSTLLRLAAGLLRPSAGAVQRPGGDRAFVFQAPTLLPWRTVAENVGLPLELRGLDPRDAVAAALAQVGLSESAGALPRALSGGMQMRASLARALVTRPALMLLDEPFSAVDAISRRALHEVFLDLWRRERFTALIVTHDIDEAVLLADRVLVLAGRPAGLRGDIPVPLPRPRAAALRHDPALGALSARVEALL